MYVDLAIAPCSWGVEDAGNPANPGWEKVLYEAQSSGFRGIELGPYGYMPQDPAYLGEKLDRRGLTLIAGTLYDDLLSPNNLQSLLEKTEITSRLLREIGEHQGNDRLYLVLIDHVREERNRSAGHPDEAQRLDGESWRRMMDHISRLSKLSYGEFGIRAVVHPHAGGYLEFDDETERFLHDISHELTGLCLDTGHLYYAGSDPAEAILKYQSRLDYLHFKDIEPGTYQKAIDRRQPFFEACLEGVMSPIGQGCVDYDSVKGALEKISYAGWATVEQERDPKATGRVVKDIQESMSFLHAHGL